MANDLNQCNFIGRVGKDPEVGYSSGGMAITNFSIACDHKYKDKEHTEWVRLVAFGKLAEIIGEFVKKGKQIFVSGRMQTDKWEDKDGNTRYTTKIIANDVQFLGGRNTEGAPVPTSQTVNPEDDDIGF
jgi:single-strand DNA-binding protein